MNANQDIPSRRESKRSLRARSGAQLLFAVLVAGVLVMAGSMAHAAPRAELWQRWTAHEPAATQIMDHSAWDALLSRYVERADNEVSRFAYSRVSAADRAALDDYVQHLAATRVSALRRAEQLAYWINLYNALTVRVVLDHYPVPSIRDIRISPGLFSSGPWGKKLIVVEGEGLSLDDIEHRILRPIWRDPRIHYAVNCASMGCPNLIDRAFTAHNADELLERGARAYVNHPRGVRIDNGRLVVSSIYHWFKDDFGGSDAGVIAHLRGYAAAPLARELSAFERIADHAYDWTLNDAAAR